MMRNLCLWPGRCQMELGSSLQHRQQRLHSQHRVQGCPQERGLAIERWFSFERIPWLYTLQEILLREYSLGVNVILACSSLKRMYRRILMGEHSRIRKSENCKEQDQEHSELGFNQNILFVHLHGSKELITKRIEMRKEHFVSPSLLQSQFDTLEPPEDTEKFMSINVEKSILEIVGEIEKTLGLNL
ncbi:probable gluconokinase isoform X2 [Narcine bancroftii]|uniref:probable gluconokinase isoform X2 n=1 Tax=Narcine bancroftii TaxID=1343680 RepID=UPI0038313668